MTDPERRAGQALQKDSGKVAAPGVVDTNVLVYAANSGAAEQEVARRMLQAAAADPAPWYLTEGIVYEFLRVSTHPRVMKSPLRAGQALSFVERLLVAGAFRLLRAGPRHWELLADLAASVHGAAGSLFFDLRTAVLMREHGVRRIYTADKDFSRFEGIDPVNPFVV